MATKNVDEIIGIPVVLPTITTAVSWAPTIANNTNLSILNAKYRQSGDWYEGFLTIAAVGTGVGGVISASLPGTVDTNVCPVGTTVGSFRFFDSGVTNYTGVVVLSSSTQIVLQRDGVASGVQGTDFTINDNVQVQFAVPITGISLSSVYGAGQATAIKPGISTGNLGWPGSDGTAAIPTTKIGETITNTYSAVATGTSGTNVVQVNLTPGKWKIRSAGASSKGGSTQLFMSMSTTVGAIDTSVPGSTFVDSPLNGPANTFVYALERTFTVSANTSVYTNIQNVGSTSTASGIMEATRVG